ncbi:hypothetical protein J2Z66_006967 [Paenibacillus eucommiae]|uniref:Uncharacterized protein n=1 Tax=Paenibacillus eucommiae TaxID=1355755 RepID=A0ABS4J699_9BACL|nr:hypothetical protein [Paenibacillus eucommiae]
MKGSESGSQEAGIWPAIDTRTHNEKWIGMTNDNHTIKIVHKGTKNPSSSHYKVAVDRFEY